MNRATRLCITTLIAALAPTTILIHAQAPQTIEIHAKRYSFEPSEITVTKGEPVTLRLISDDVPHSLVVKDLNINQTITKDHPATVTFTPQATGDFRGKCGRFCGSGHGSMLFTVHVK